MSGKYRIVIKGHLDPDWVNWFGEMTLHYDEQDNTVLTGFITDQPALHGILDRLRDLNLTLISVTQLKPDSDSSQQKESKNETK